MNANHLDAASSAMFIRVDQAACLLGISRSLAYELANQWLESDGASGLPAVRLGRRILIKQAAIDEMAAVGPC